ncbi:hypothetical protein [Roseovarius indicus]|uniref:hypothetical protein n=1 Tax=Roseovarius indicus TaxID=540747 RepID=UPI0010FF396E|nr:hypothetical protein [Roseovarius indicus]
MADVDELIMRIEAAEQLLSKRFKDVSEGLENFDPSLLHYHEERCHRLLRILSVQEELPVSQLASDETLVPTFELKTKDKKRVLDLCAQMRKIVLATDVFDQPHRRRLLNRIAGIEAQVEQPKGLLDVVRSGVSDVGETLGKFGMDIKPLTDRMTEVAQIARDNSEEYRKIPSPTEIKKLPKPDIPTSDED